MRNELEFFNFGYTHEGGPQILIECSGTHARPSQFPFQFYLQFMEKQIEKNGRSTEHVIVYEEHQLIE